MQINAVFKRDGETRTGARTSCAASAPTAWPRATGDELVLRSSSAIPGRQSRAQMLQNKEFVDAKVEIFGKHGSRCG